MIVKRLLCPERARRIPEQFSWVDHRLVREHHIERCSTAALALYLLLITVGDADGLSYYSDAKVVQLTSMHECELRQARRELIDAGLIAYRKPLYQVLSLAPSAQAPTTPPRANGCASLGEILRTATGGVS